MKYEELSEGRKVFALINRYGRTGWDADKSQWNTVRVVRANMNASGPGPVYIKKDQAIEDWHGYKSRGGSYVLVQTVEADKAKGEPSYFAVGQYYLVNQRQVVDFDNYQARTAKVRAKIEKQMADQDAASRTREALDAAWLLHIIREANVSDEAAGAIQQLVNSGKLTANRPWKWEPTNESNGPVGESTESVG